jgi:Toprim domain-containing protein
VNAADVAHVLGGRRAGSGWIVRCPAHDDRNPSLSITDARDGKMILVHCHAGCPQAEVISALKDRGLWPTDNWRSGKIFRPKQAQLKYDQCEREDADRTAFALRLWKEARDWRGTVVEKYLASRDLFLPAEFHSEAIRFHPSLKLDRKIVGGMVALFRDITTDEPCGIHRTFLDRNGRKVERKMLGCIKHAAIKLDPGENVTLGLTIGEGIETCIAAGLAGFNPVWALGSATAIANFPVLAGIEAITILGEVNDGGANACAAQACAARWMDAEKDVLSIEPLVGGDMNDVWREVVG